MKQGLPFFRLLHRVEDAGVQEHALIRLQGHPGLVHVHRQGAFHGQNVLKLLVPVPGHRIAFQVLRVAGNGEQGAAMLDHFPPLGIGHNILLEGQLGTMKDPDHGIYPMVTSSSTLAAYGAIGAGIPPYEIKKIIAVTKAYSSAVGAGAFVSEIFGDEADELRRRGGDGGEFGATTGRPRRMGWYDCVASHYGCRLQGATDVALTVLDVLGYLDEIPVCVGYEIDGQVTKEFPVTCKLEKAKPVYEVLPGWKCDIRGIRTYEELPENCRKYIEFIENQIGYPITMVSNGPGRDDIIYRNSPLA